jgi:hypothetical protein
MKVKPLAGVGGEIIGDRFPLTKSGVPCDASHLEIRLGELNGFNILSGGG